MFFSVIIPTYNPRKYLSTMLESIVKNDCLDDIEVIISDDCSTEEFDDILDQFNTLHFVKIKNKKHVGFPRNGRQHGTEVAKGKWLCFADQDDEFVDHAFDIVKDIIINNNIEKYCYSDFILKDMETGGEIVTDGGAGWTHGKFIERSFWKEHNLKYDEVKYCEDINVTTRIKCILIAEKYEPFMIKQPLYIWKRWKDTLASDQYFINSMIDYVKSSYGIAVEFLEKYKDDPYLKEQFNFGCIESFFHLYFYLQGPLFYNNKRKVLEVILFTMPLFEEHKDIMGYTTHDFLNYVIGNCMSMYSYVRNADFNQIPFIEQMLFSDWVLNYFGA